jgi:enoyl-CoA hydratase/carnithine racemase
MPDALLLTRDGPVATLLLNRPERRNAVTRAMWEALPPLLEMLAHDEATALLVLRGAGGHFCGGADIGEFAAGYATPEQSARSNAAIRAGVEALAAFPKPALALIRGACVGGGVSLALACDLRLAGPEARFAITPAKLGLTYTLGDTSRLVRAVGVNRAKELLFTARTLDAGEALRIGLLDRVAEEPEAALAEMLEAMRTLSRPALRGLKRMVEAVASGAHDETPELAALFDDSFAGEDFREGYAAFLAKRSPRFTAP